MTDIYLLVIAAELGLLTVAMVTTIIISITNNSYARRAQAESEANTKTATANLLANMGVVPGKGMPQGEGVMPPPCGEGDCPGCKAEGNPPGQYM